MIKRILLDLLLFLSIFLAPFWLVIIFAFILSFYFKRFYEIIPSFLLIDLLYGINLTKFFEIPIITLFIGIIILILIEFLKKKLRFYV
ncbi:hypothetical protein A2995_01295 [Candidatus Nomurabacteria bacterium RIFCSPLOWO2_01_FULL_33_24]|uniref:Uncharacterized protein n=1 Tax=Candidatus Nomurabacteria bacterium RIFCSPLOWO2_01_FULL_33_24 TaxID=1801765 RepID=A0A1F6X048_9BACT|nr:MAG: hypothetical protein A2995_01295 [Candidatus Nomurabacteria bacterium RIFCSPLOWO2_01_FULL_33_24]